MALTITAPVDRRDFRCAVGVWYSNLDPKDQAAFDAAVTAIRDQRERAGSNVNTGYTAGWLQRELESNGYKVGRTTLLRHVCRDCRCEQT